MVTLNIQIDIVLRFARNLLQNPSQTRLLKPAYRDAQHSLAYSDKQITSHVSVHVYPHTSLTLTHENVSLIVIIGRNSSLDLHEDVWQSVQVLLLFLVIIILATVRRLVHKDIGMVH